MDSEEKLKEIALRLEGLKTTQALFHSCLRTFLENLKNEELLCLSKNIQYSIECIQKFATSKKN